MLEETQVPTKEVASICGYPSLQYMYAIFKKHFEQTPTQYRESNKTSTTKMNAA